MNKLHIRIKITKDNAVSKSISSSLMFHLSSVYINPIRSAYRRNRSCCISFRDTTECGPKTSLKHSWGYKEAEEIKGREHTKEYTSRAGTWCRSLWWTPSKCRSEARPEPRPRRSRLCPWCTRGPRTWLIPSRYSWTPRCKPAMQRNRILTT